MFTTEDLKEYSIDFQQVGITVEKEQKDVLEYFYQLGKIIYNLNTNSDEKEN